MRRSRFRTGTILLAAAALVPAAALTATARPAESAAKPPAKPFVEGTKTVAAYDYDNAIRERIAVDVPKTDNDANGVTDQITVDIIRPGEAAAAGIDVPVIIQASPYYAGDPRNYFDDKGIRQIYGSWLDNYFVPRGYAVAFVDMPGTHRSTGCTDVGGDYEVLGTKAVIDWLNNRVPGYNPDGSKAKADWSTGKAGMIGTSWNGTIANSVASTGVRGLETIVPIAAISSWYDYTRSFGVPFYDAYMEFLYDYVSNDKEPRCVEHNAEVEADSDTPTGSYSKFWDPRNYNLDASKVRASVFAIHGLDDENVKTRHFGEWWEEIAKRNVPRKIFLHQGVHLDGFSFRDAYVDQLHPWFDYWLQGLKNNVMKQPQATIMREDGSYTTEARWPAAGVKQTKLKLSKSANAKAGGLSIAAASSDPVSFTGTSAPSQDSVVLDPTATRPDRAVFLSDELERAVRISGTGKVSVRLKSNKVASGIKARIVDYGTETRFSNVTNVPNTSVCWGDGNELDKGCYAQTQVNTRVSDAAVVIRTLADVGHYKTLNRKEYLQSNKWYDLSFELNADDIVFKAGHRLGLVLTVESDNPSTPFTGATLTLDPTHSSLTLPLTGYTAALDTAGSPQARVAADSLAQPEPETNPRKLMEQMVETSR
ncbi:CocE/NonD family hydrolase [Kribbella sandramycini]|uniref:CocE/NonD family hydrolase n=1 Tax=Kribbella sandramycini TaxID=60450 RepID=A0A7Y4P4A3_9ACTN|nr:CocE/NonD family hydrolase [Kribbella sandramycini]MBB6565987.1 X-Pro dipeptidyl-peptidase [Kribbella sandramycini]NOL44989.1 CocE/NonD family hydrolase [Kribbella sandramycini]